MNSVSTLKKEMSLSLYQKAKGLFTSKKSAANFSRRKFFLGQKTQSEHQPSGADEDIQVKEIWYVHFLNWILQVNFCSNHVRSSKYTIFSFLILNLLEQFRRSANFCYLCIAIIQVTSVLLSKTKTVLRGHYHKPSFYKAPIYLTVWKVNIYNQFSTVDTFSHTQCQWVSKSNLVILGTDFLNLNLFVSSHLFSCWGK